MTIMINNLFIFFLFFYLQRTPLRPMIAEYDPKKRDVKTELSDMVLVK